MVQYYWPLNLMIFCVHVTMLPPPTKKCNGFYQSFPIRHRLRCRHGGIVIKSHNEVRDDLLYLAWWYFPPSCVHNKPLIHRGHIRQYGEVRKGRGRLETRGDVIIQDLWESQNDSIIDIILGDPGCDSHKKEPTRTLLDWWENKRRTKTASIATSNGIFSPFVLSFDDMLGKEALVVLANLSRLIAAKLEEPISNVWGWVNGRITITVVRSYYFMICGDPLPSTLKYRDQDWE